MDEISAVLKCLELTEAPQYTESLKELVEQYGHYLYVELQLPAGKEKFYQELQQFPAGIYQPPHGTFIMALVNEKVVGCVCVKKWDALSCEMKRMYVLPLARRMGIGRQLCEAAINWARKNKYRSILLDTNEEMQEAVHLYERCGFHKIDPYCINENPSPVFMEFYL
jgi:Acetyltransferases